MDKFNNHKGLIWISIITIIIVIVVPSALKLFLRSCLANYWSTYLSNVLGAVIALSGVLLTIYYSKTKDSISDIHQILYNTLSPTYNIQIMFRNSTHSDKYGMYTRFLSLISHEFSSCYKDLRKNIDKCKELKKAEFHLSTINRTKIARRCEKQEILISKKEKFINEKYMRWVHINKEYVEPLMDKLISFCARLDLLNTIPYKNMYYKKYQKEINKYTEEYKCNLYAIPKLMQTFRNRHDEYQDTSKMKEGISAFTNMVSLFHIIEDRVDKIQAFCQELLKKIMLK